MGPSTPSPAKMSEDYEGKDAMRTLQQAHEIAGNPALMGRARRHAKKAMKALKPVAAGKPLGKR